jgi:hypothetical protein
MFIRPLRMNKTLVSAFLIASMLSGYNLFAQVKIGSNPTVIGTDVNLEVEATNGNRTVVQKSNGNVGIGTGVPGNKLEVNQGTAGNSGLRFTQMNSTTPATTTGTAPLGVNATGDVVVIPGATSAVFRGTVYVADIGGTAPAVPIPVTGYISSATKTLGVTAAGPSFTLVAINFPSLGTTEYSAVVTVESGNGLGGGFNESTLTPVTVLNKTATGFNVYLRENAAIGQDIKLNIILAR